MTREKIKEILKNKEKHREELMMMFVRKTRCCHCDDGRLIRLPLSWAASGIVHCNTPEVRECLPAEYRNAKECIMIYSTCDLTEGTNQNEKFYYLADQIDTYDKRYWKVIRTVPWWDGEFKFYQALAVRTEESFWEKERREKKALAAQAEKTRKE